MKIRPFNPHDLPRLTVLFDLYRQFYRQPSDLVACEVFLGGRLGKGESTVLVGELNGELQGFVQLYPSFSSVGLQRTWILNDLFVAEGARGKKLGEALMQASMDWVVAHGEKRLSLMTAVTNTTAQKLYEKMGWKRDQEYFTYTWRAK